jgi:hypothetical protein
MCSSAAPRPLTDRPQQHMVGLERRRNLRIRRRLFAYDANQPTPAIQEQQAC